MLTDRKKIEQALFPALLESILLRVHGIDKSKWDKNTTLAIGHLHNYVKEHLEANLRLIRRFERVHHIVTDYFINNKFDTRKAISTILEIVAALSYSGIIEYNGDCFKTMAAIHTIFQEDIPKILKEDYDKYEKSYTKNAIKIIELLKKNHYFQEVNIVESVAA